MIIIIILCVLWGGRKSNNFNNYLHLPTYEIESLAVSLSLVKLLSIVSLSFIVIIIYGVVWQSSLDNQLALWWKVGFNKNTEN